MDLSRREFFAVTAAGAASLYLANFSHAAEFLAEAASPMDLGPVAQFKKGVNDQFLHSKKVLVIRQQDKLFVSSGKCTHHNAVLEVVDGQAQCPLHGSRFDTPGHVTQGPATRSLSRYAVQVKDGHLWADPARLFDEAHWNDPAASVNAK